MQFSCFGGERILDPRPDLIVSISSERRKDIRYEHLREEITIRTMEFQIKTDLLTRQIDAGKNLLKQQKIRHADYDPWRTANKRVLLECFGEGSPEVARFEPAPPEQRRIPPNAPEEIWEKERRKWIQERTELLGSYRDKLLAAEYRDEMHPQSSQRDDFSDDRTLTWLHISDLHFKESRPWQQVSVLDGLIRDVIKKLPDEGLTPDLIFVTGDIAQAGKRAQYSQARAFFDELSSITGVAPNRWFLVPGNHDVDRGLVAPITKRTSLVEMDHVNEVLEDLDSRKQFTTRQREFFKFTIDFLGPERAFSEEQPWKVDAVEVNGFRLAIISLNSAWASWRDHEKGLLFVGEYQASKALREANCNSPHLKIALMHHPLSWLMEFDEHKIEGLLRGVGGAHFVLRGHLHEGRIKQESNPDACSLELAAGACWQDATYPHGVTVVRIAPLLGRGEVHMWRYDKAGRGHWKRDNFLYENFKDGTWRFPIPASWNLSASSTQSRPPQANGGLREQLRTAQELPAQPGRSPGIEVEISTLLARVGSRTVPLSQCFAEALGLASRVGDADLMRFCQRELAGYDERLNEYRAVKAYASLTAEINIDAYMFGGSASRAMAYMSEHTEHFIQSKLWIGHPLSRIESERGSDTGLWCINMPFSEYAKQIGFVIPDSPPCPPEHPVVVYGCGDMFKTVLESLRAELTKCLISLLSSPSVTPRNTSKTDFQDDRIIPYIEGGSIHQNGDSITWGFRVTNEGSLPFEVISATGRWLSSIELRRWMKENHPTVKIPESFTVLCEIPLGGRMLVRPGGNLGDKGTTIHASILIPLWTEIGMPNRVFSHWRLCVEPEITVTVADIINGRQKSTTKTFLWKDYNTKWPL